jgi:hypothetical protein
MKLICGLILAANLTTAHAQSPVTRRATARDTLPLSDAVRGSTKVAINRGGIRDIEIDRAFRYIGGHRFILGGVADAEQHAFVVADRTGSVQRFYWVQLERYLPSAANATYNYDQDSFVVRHDVEWRVQGRRYTSPPDPASDRAELYSLLAKAGLRPPQPAARVRLVHLTSDDRRSELMIIYAEASPSSSPLEQAELNALLDRAFAGIRVTRR